MPQTATVPVKRQSFSFKSQNSTNTTTYEAASQVHDLQILQWQTPDVNRNTIETAATAASVTAATLALAQAVKSQKNGGANIYLAKSGQAIVGVYGGAQILGIYSDTTGELHSVKAALGGWNNGTRL